MHTAPGHRRELHDAEREVLRLAALVGRIEGARGVPAAVQERQRAGIGVEVDVRLGELQRGEGRRQQAGLGQAAHPLQRVDHARVAPGELAVEQLVVVVDAELLQQRLVHEVRAGIGPVADAERHRRDALGLGLLDHVEEGVGRRAAGSSGTLTPSSAMIFLL